MPLNELKNDLYRDNKDGSRKVEGTHLSHDVLDQTRTGFEYESGWKKEDKGVSLEEKKKTGKFIMFFGVFLTIMLMVSIFIFVKSRAYQQDRVNISFEGPSEVKGGENVKYLLKITNENASKLNNIKISLNYSSKFKVEQEDNPELSILNSENSEIYLDDMGSESEAYVVLVGKFYSPQDTNVYIKAKISYSPRGLSVIHERENQFGVTTISSSVYTEVFAPSSAVDGDAFDYVIDYFNSGGEIFENAFIKVEYANGFEFISADPRPSENNNIWELGSLAPEAKGKIYIHGSLRGNESEGKPLKVEIGKNEENGSFLAYQKVEKRTSISIPTISIWQEVSGHTENTVNVANMLDYKIRFKNNGKSTLRDLIVRAEINANILDYNKIQPSDGGYFEGKTNTMVWKYSEVPVLRTLPAGAEGDVSFSVNVFENIPIEKEEDKNFIIKSVAMLDTPDIKQPDGNNRIIRSASKELKLNTQVFLETKGYYKDLNIENYGPMPLKLGQETSYVLHFDVVNTFNDISGARVTATIPAGVKWTGRVYPSGEKISYDERTNEIVWEIGNIPSAKGILSPKKKVSFQVSIVPQVNQNGGPIILLNGSKLTAQDNFTGRKFFSEQAEKTTSLVEDISLDDLDYKFIMQ